MTPEEIAASSNCFTCMSPDQLRAATVYLLEQIRLNGSGGTGPYVEIAGDTMTGALSFSGTTNPGVRLNNLTTVQRNALAAPAAGMVLWDTTQSRMSVYNGIAWTDGFVRLAGDTMTGALLNTTNGALSAPAFHWSGTPITGGTATTTKPLVLIETTGATSTAWSTSGTMLGVNAPSGFTGSIVDFQLNGTSRASLSSTGTFNSSSFNASSAGSIGWSDVVLVRDGAADTLALRRTTNAQAFRVYNTWTDASNGEWFAVDWKSVVNECIIGPTANGTGTQRQIAFQVGGSRRWLMTTAGHFIAATDNAYDIGASGATRPRNVFIAGGITHGSATLLTTTTALTNGAGANTGTLTNSPVTGNPTKWIPINDNGTTRYIPAW